MLMGMKTKIQTNVEHQQPNAEEPVQRQMSSRNSQLSNISNNSLMKENSMDSDEKLKLIEEKMIQQEKFRDRLNLKFNQNINQQRKQLNIHRNLKTFMKKKVVKENMLSKLGDKMMNKFKLKNKRVLSAETVNDDKKHNPMIKELMGSMRMTLKH